ncbi:Spy0128 family protein, partial [Streptococcus suis]
TRAELAVKKTLTGRELKEDEFEFVLKNEANEEVATAKNDKDGNVKFKELTFDKAGTYTYTVTEVVGGDTAIIYDSLKIKVTVVVTDDGEGKLIAKVEYPEDIEFNNEYVEPTTTTTTEEPMTTITSEKTRKTALPSTGDKGNIWVAIAGFVALITIVVMVYYRKSKNA